MIQHTKEGVAILRDKPFYEVARQIARNHHEKWDGTGYPEGRRGMAIPLSARIVAVADVFDALTTERPYKRAWTSEEALAELVSHKGTGFDPAVVQAFEEAYCNGMVESIRERFPTPRYHSLQPASTR